MIWSIFVSINLTHTLHWHLGDSVRYDEYTTEAKAICPGQQKERMTPYVIQLKSISYGELLKMSNLLHDKLLTPDRMRG